MEPLDAKTLASEVANANFADERLNARLKAIFSRLSADPSESLPKLFDSAGLEAAYRFFANHRVTPEAILAPHIAATKERCTTEESFLVIHDSTTFSYRPDGERQGLERVRRTNPRSNQAFFAHASLVVTADGSRRPLGIGALSHWTRTKAVKGREHLRWEEQALQASASLGGRARAIHVMDREADDYLMFHRFIGDGHRFVVRCLNNRLLEEPSAHVKLREHVSTIAATVEREIPLERRKSRRNSIQKNIHPARSPRTATLSVTATSVAIKRPKFRRRPASPVAPSLLINVVRVWEATPPDGEEPIEWYLYTNEPIDTPEQQLAIVDHYRARWTIEEYFKALKTGCDFESRQLGDYEGLVNLLATFAPIAYRALLIRSESRRVPDADAATVLTPDHIAVLRAKGRTKLSEKPTVREIYLAVAHLGGHIKHSKKDPGWLTLSRGLEELETLTEGWLLAKLQFARDQR